MNALTIKHENTNRKTYRGIRKRLTISSFKSNGKTRENWGKLAFFFLQKLSNFSPKFQEQKSGKQNHKNCLSVLGFNRLLNHTGSPQDEHKDSNSKTWKDKNTSEAFSPRWVF